MTQPHLFDQQVKTQAVASRSLDCVGDEFILRFELDNREIAAYVRTIPGWSLRFDLGGWTVRAVPIVAGPLREVADRFDFKLTPAAARAMNFLLSQPMNRPAERAAPVVAAAAPVKSRLLGKFEYHNKKKFRITFPYRQEIVDIIKSMPDREYAKPASGPCWYLPLMHLEQAVKLLPDFTVDAKLTAELPAPRPHRIPVVLPDLTKIRSAQGYKLFDHQIKGITWLVETGYGLLGDDMGIGKTCQSLLAAKIASRGLMPIKVISPASLQINWKVEAKMWGVDIEVLSQGKIPDPPDCEFVLICDEAHAYQTPESQRTQAFMRWANSPYCAALYLLTGTPIRNGRPINLYPLLKALRHPVAKDQDYYLDRYCWDQERGTGYNGARNLDELHRRITRKIEGDALSKPILLRRLKSQCLDLPAKRRIIKPITMTAKAQKQYNATFLALQVSYRQRIAAGVISENDALVMISHLRHAASAGKIETGIEMAQEIIDEGRSVGIFCEFLDTARALKTALNAVSITGDDTDRQVEANKELFQTKKVKAIICTSQRGGFGHTLTAASDVILLDRPFVPGTATQAEDRFHRISQQNDVTVYWIQAAPIDEWVDEIIQVKSERISLILQGKRKTLRGTNGISAKDFLDAIFEN